MHLHGLACVGILLLTCCGGDPDPAGGPDASQPVDASSADAMPLTCFDFSLDAEIPLAIDGTFEAASPTWRRPHDESETCPAAALLPTSAAQVPFVAFAFCNTDSVEHTFDFEMLSQEGPNAEPALDDPYLILYRGQGIPTDPLGCLAVNDDIPGALDAKDSEILGISVPPGEAITVVGTTFTFSPTEDVGTGYYILLNTLAD